MMAVTLDDKLVALPADRRAKVERRTAEIVEEELTLRQLRQAHARTQVELARRLRMKQPNVAKLEQRSDMLLSTLRAYVAAMGGELELVARFKGKKPVRLAGIGDLGEVQE
jgi:hypothetical protein